jgi:hypothetical protein
MVYAVISGLVVALRRYRQKILHRDVDTAYISSYVGIVNLSDDALVGRTLEVKMVLFGLVFLTMTIIATLYFT